MIFKVIFSKSLISRFPNNTYVSFCESKLGLNKQQFQDFVFDFLYDRKLLNISSTLFRCEMHDTYDYKLGMLIKCYIKNTKKTLFCKLEQLVKYQERQPPVYINPYSKPNSSAHENLLKRLNATIQDEMDAQIISTLNNVTTTLPTSLFNNAAVSRPRPLDYQSVARKTFVVEELPPANREIYYDHNIDDLTLPRLLEDEGNHE